MVDIGASLVYFAVRPSDALWRTMRYKLVLSLLLHPPTPPPASLLLAYRDLNRQYPQSRLRSLCQALPGYHAGFSPNHLNWLSQ